MNLTKFSIEKNRITVMCLAVILVLGLSFYQSLSRDSMPPYTVRVATIVSQFPGASPERVEQLVSYKIEKVAQELPELKQVTSTSRTGLSVVTVTLIDDVAKEDLQSVWDRLRRKLNAMNGLPNGVNPNLNDDGIGDVYGIVVGMTSDGYSYSKMKDYADDLRDAFIGLPAAAKVEIKGAQEERVFVEFDNARLKEYGLSSTRLQQFIGATNILSSGGKIDLDDERIILEPTGNFNNVEDIRNLLIPVGQGESARLIPLGNITTIKKGYIDPASQIVNVNGQRALTLHIKLKEGGNITKLGQEVDAMMTKWQNRLPVGVELHRVSAMDTYIDSIVDNFVGNLVQSIVIVLVVMLIFLGFRTGIIIASLIPMVVIATLMVMGFINMGLNQVTLAALIMALGMLVDNGIVVAETIMVKLGRGTDKRTAAIQAFEELWMPLLISTLTTSAAFLAFYLSPNTMGDMVGPLFVIISIALLSSWLISLSIITLSCYLFLKTPNKDEAPKESFVDRAIDALKAQYDKLIVAALHKRYLTIGVIMGAFVISLYLFQYVSFVFFPDSERNMLTVDINLAEGTKLARTQQVVKQLEGFFNDSLVVDKKRTQGITSWSAFIGEGPESYDLGYSPDEPNENYAHILVNTSHFEDNGMIIEKVNHFCLEQIPDANIKIKRLSGGAAGNPVEIRIIGKNADDLSVIANKVKTQLSKTPGTINVKDDWGPKSKKFVIKIDQNRAQKAGITSQDIAVSLSTFLDGYTAGEYREEDKSIPIVMRSSRNQTQSLALLESLNIYAQSSGNSVPLMQVASIIPQWQYATIKRYNLERSVSVSCELTADGNASEITNAITPWLEEQKTSWPEGVHYLLDGDAKQSSEAMGSVTKYLPISAFIIVMLLVIQFSSYRKTFIILSTIPLGVIGVVIGLLLFRESFGFMPFLGLISLAGIIINNAIVLVDRIEVEQSHHNREIRSAIVTACLQRFRPIILTTFTTVFGMIPLYLSGGEMWEGMAISIMIGLLFGTIVTLVFVPVLFSLLYKVKYDDTWSR